MNLAREEVTGLLQRVSDGDEDAMDRVVPLVYDALHKLAAGYLRRERPDHTLQPTALVNEAFLKLVDQTRVSWESRGHFLGIAATSMRRILVDHARGKARQKRAAPGRRVALEEAASVADAPELDLVALDESMNRLRDIDPRKVQVMELRYFAGRSINETAETLGISPATVKRDWDFARLWLLRDMGEPS
jgi:RNA polymerase sigma factor (TIGR02999 family)